jgi:c-di-GMP-binding flagellar brake protein YcgR
LEGVIPNPRNTHLLIVDIPTEVRVYNQREGYRVATEVQLEAAILSQVTEGGPWAPTGEGFDATVVDLSIGGCAIESVYDLPSGGRISLTLPLLDQWVELRATCVRMMASDQGGSWMRYGLEFRELSLAQQDILHKAVLAMQLEDLADDDEGESEEEDNSGE